MELFSSPHRRCDGREASARPSEYSQSDLERTLVLRGWLHATEEALLVNVVQTMLRLGVIEAAFVVGFQSLTTATRRSLEFT